MSQNDSKVTSDQPTFTTTTQNDMRLWALIAPGRAVSWSAYGGYSGSIEVHSSTPQSDGDVPLSTNCPVIGGVCYGDGGGLAGQELGCRWREAGEDDAVIRAELESWYEREFGGESR